MADTFNKLELAIFDWLRKTYDNQELSAQIGAATFIRRDWTKVGFYVYFEVPKALKPISLSTFRNRWPIDGPSLKSENIECGGGSVIWGTDGYINCIEMYAYGQFFDEHVMNFEVE